MSEAILNHADQAVGPMFGVALGVTALFVGVLAFYSFRDHFSSE